MKIHKDAIQFVRNQLDCWKRDLVHDISGIEEDNAEGIIMRDDANTLDTLRSELNILAAFYAILDGILEEGGKND